MCKCYLNYKTVEVTVKPDVVIVKWSCHRCGRTEVTVIKGREKMDK